LRIHKLLAIFTLIFLFLLIFVLSIEIIIPTRAKGVFNYTRVSGEPVSSISIYLPLFENGENVFKISHMEAKTTSGLVWAANPGPSGYDEYPDYWILTGPPLKPGDKLVVNFIMEDVRDINYELYPWKVVSDTETTVTVNIEKSFSIRLVTLVEEYRYPLTVTFTLLTLITASLSLTTWTLWRRTTIAAPPPELSPEFLFETTNELKQKISNIKNKIKSLRSKLQQKSQELAQLEKREEEITNKCKDLSRRVIEEREKIEELSTEGSIVQVGFGDKVVKITDRIKQYTGEELEKLREEYNKKLVAIDKDYEEAKAFIKSKSDELRVREIFEKRYQDLEKWRIAQLDRILRSAEEKLKEDIRKHQESAKKCEEELEKLKSELETIEKRKDQIKEEIGTIQAELQSLESELKQYEEEIQKYERIINEHKEKLASKIKSMKKEIDEDVWSIEDSLKNVKNLKDKISRYQDLVNKLSKKYDRSREYLPKDFCKEIENALNKSKAHLDELKKALKELENEARKVKADLNKIITDSKTLDEAKNKVISAETLDELKKYQNKAESVYQTAKSELSVLRDRVSKIADRIWAIYPVCDDIEAILDDLETISGCLKKLSKETRVEILKWLNNEAKRKGLESVSELLHRILELFGPQGKASSSDDCIDCLRAIRLAYIFRGLQDRWPKIRKLLEEKDPEVFKRLYDHKLPENIRLSFLYRENYMEDKPLDVDKTVPMKIGNRVQLVSVDFLISRAIDVSKIVADAKLAPPTLKPGVGVAAGVLQLAYGTFVDWVSTKLLSVAKLMLLKWAVKVTALKEKPYGYFFLPDEKTVYAYYYDTRKNMLWVWIEEYENGRVIRRKLIYWPGKTPSLPPVIPRPLTNIERQRRAFLRKRSVKRLLEELKGKNQ